MPVRGLDRVYLGCESEDIAENVLLCLGFDFGASASKQLQGTEKRGRVYIGTVPNTNTEVSILYGGVGSPRTGVITELLCSTAAKRIIAVGYAGSIQRGVEIGDLVIVTGAIKDEGTSSHYAPAICPAVPSFLLTTKLYGSIVAVADTATPVVHAGIVWTTDAPLRELETLETWQKLNAIAVDMECSAFFTVSNEYRRESAAVLVVGDSPLCGEHSYMLDIVQAYPRTAHSLNLAIKGTLRAFGNSLAD